MGENMNNNGNFMEIVVFILFVCFIGMMSNMEWEAANDSLQIELKNKKSINNLFEERVAWDNRLDRIKEIGSIKHDGDPETSSFDIVLEASFKDADDLTYSWEHLGSWDNQDSRNSLTDEVVFKPDNTSNKVDCVVNAGIHEFQVTVTDTYGAESSEMITVQVNGETNSAPAGYLTAYKKPEAKK